MPSSTGVQFTVGPVQDCWDIHEVHCTLVWAGKEINDKEAMELMQDTWELATRQSHSLTTFIRGEDWLGPMQDQHAWLLDQTGDMYEMRETLRHKWNMSQHRQWRPHITAPRNTIIIGRPILLTGLEVWHKNQFRVCIPFAS
jgi:hypothetical protein